MAKTVFFDVDTQKDFMFKEGSLYVPNADKIIKNLKKLTDHAREKRIQIIGSVDRHFKTDPELKRNGGPFPDHCMNGTEGQEKIEETKPLNPAFIENKKYKKEELENLLRKKDEIFLEKQSYDVFTNQNTDIILKDVERAVVYGVAIEYCVDAVIKRLTKRDIDVYAVIDAMMPLKESEGEKKLQEWEDMGVHLINTEQALTLF